MSVLRPAATCAARGTRGIGTGSGRTARARASSSGSTSASSGLTGSMGIVIGILAASLHPSRRLRPRDSWRRAAGRAAVELGLRAPDSAPSGRARACRPRVRPGWRSPARSRAGSRRTGRSRPARRCRRRRHRGPRPPATDAPRACPGLSIRRPPPGRRTSCRRVVVCLPEPSDRTSPVSSRLVVPGEPVHERRLAHAGGPEERAGHAGSDQRANPLDADAAPGSRRSESGSRRRRPRARRRPTRARPRGRPS